MKKRINLHAVQERKDAASRMKEFLKKIPRYLFFTGKGGVGKTSMACSTAVALADSGKNILLISTDPASNLDEVIETSLCSKPKSVKDVDRLKAMNIDPMKAAEEYRESILGPLEGLLPEDAIRNMEEELSGGCTIEVATFNVFSRIIGDKDALKEYDHIVLDTAPTGHTLRLLSLPAAWSEFIAENKTGTSCLGSISSIKDQRKYYEATADILKDQSQTMLVMVTRPESMALKEASRASIELYEQGMHNQFLIINGVFKKSSEDKTARAFEEKSNEALLKIPDRLKNIPNTKVKFYPSGAVGIRSLRKIIGTDTQSFDEQVSEISGKSEILNKLDSWDNLFADLSKNGKGVIMTMGKGGVGKTSMAAAIALNLAEAGHKVHLTTTDPAAHLEGALEGGGIELKVTRIDPKFETEKYIKKVVNESRAHLSNENIELLEEEMRSPCIEEIAVFNAFAAAVSEGENSFIVVDTAPTGHTLLLLDATESYHKQVERNAQELSDDVKKLLPRLRDPDFTKILITTLPEATPVHEAESLQLDLNRAGITPYGWIINQSFAVTHTEDPILRVRGNNELKHIKYVSESLSQRTVVSQWHGENIEGAENLKRLIIDNI